ncbi:MAG: sulfate ABC transporter substrate-binding protein [Planctomycetota bacterium]|nr:MAG: sulfate ABC transporter substrate-binding protein [Planctomycetota bacterium]
MKTSTPMLSLVVFLAGLSTAWSTRVHAGPQPPAAARKLTLAAYTTPREAYGKELLPGFAQHWKQKTGEEVKFQESYQASGAQARAIIGGFEADVAALSLEADVDKIAGAKLITHDWKAGEHGGMVTRSIVVIAVRKGNPKNIQDWDDLAKPGVKVLTPNVKTSGGAMWNIAAIYGAALRGSTSAKKGDVAGAVDLLARILRNVEIMDKGARESMITFENGIGDAAITYENEVLVGRMAGKDYEYVVPRSTVLIENPVAVVDVYAARHDNRELADAFVQYLFTLEAQRAFGRYGLRPVDARAMDELKDKLPRVSDQFTVRDLGGWPQLSKTVFNDGGVYDRAIALKDRKN